MKPENEQPLEKQLNEHARQLSDLAVRPPFECLVREHKTRTSRHRKRNAAGIAVGVFSILACWLYLGSANGVNRNAAPPSSGFAATDFNRSQQPRPDQASTQEERIEQEQLIAEIVAVLGTDPAMPVVPSPNSAQPLVFEVKYEDLTPNEQTAVQRLLTVGFDQWN